VTTVRCSDESYQPSSHKIYYKFDHLSEPPTSFKNIFPEKEHCHNVKYFFAQDSWLFVFLPQFGEALNIHDGQNQNGCPTVSDNKNICLNCQVTTLGWKPALF